jgi:hypothetical protein
MLFGGMPRLQFDFAVLPGPAQTAQKWNQVLNPDGSILET